MMLGNIWSYHRREYHGVNNADATHGSSETLQRKRMQDRCTHTRDAHACRACDHLCSCFDKLAESFLQPPDAADCPFHSDESRFVLAGTASFFGRGTGWRNNKTNFMRDE